MLTLIPIVFKLKRSSDLTYDDYMDNAKFKYYANIFDIDYDLLNGVE